MSATTTSTTPAAAITQASSVTTLVDNLRVAALAAIPDYNAMSDGDLVQALGDDAMKWSEAFCQRAQKMGIAGIERDWMVAWFASAIEHSDDVRRWRREAAERKAQ